MGQNSEDPANSVKAPKEGR